MAQDGQKTSKTSENIGPDVLAKKIALLTIVSFKKIYGKLYNVTKKTSNTIQKLEKKHKNKTKRNHVKPRNYLRKP